MCAKERVMGGFLWSWMLWICVTLYSTICVDDNGCCCMIPILLWMVWQFIPQLLWCCCELCDDSFHCLLLCCWWQLLLWSCVMIDWSQLLWIVWWWFIHSAVVDGCLFSCCWRTNKPKGVPAQLPKGTTFGVFVEEFQNKLCLFPEEFRNKPFPCWRNVGTSFVCWRNAGTSFVVCWRMQNFVLLILASVEVVSLSGCLHEALMAGHQQHITSVSSASPVDRNWSAAVERGPWGTTAAPAAGGVAASDRTIISMAISTTREELTDEKEVTIFDHLEERRGRLLIAVAEASCSWSSFSCSCSVWIILPGESREQLLQLLSEWAQSMHLHSANLFGNCLKSGPSLLNNLGFQSEKWGWSCVPELQSIAKIQAHWLIVEALHCIALLAITGSNEVGFRRSDAVGVEIHCCRCCDCSCHCHSLNRYIDTMSCGRPTHWVVHWRCFLFIFLRARSCQWFSSWQSWALAPFADEFCHIMQMCWKPITWFLWFVVGPKRQLIVQKLKLCGSSCWVFWNCGITGWEMKNRMQQACVQNIHLALLWFYQLHRWACGASGGG